MTLTALRGMSVTLRAEAPLLLVATLVQALPGALGQVVSLGALWLLAFRLLWRGLRAQAPPSWPGAAGLALLIRMALALGVWVMLVSLGFVGVQTLLAPLQAQSHLPELLALLGGLMLATLLTLALAVPGLPPPLLPPETAPHHSARLGLLAALRPGALRRTLGWLLSLVLPACALALALRLFLPGPLASAALTAAVALTSLTLAHLFRGLAPEKPGAAIFA